MMIPYVNEAINNSRRASDGLVSRSASLVPAVSSAKAPARGHVIPYRETFSEFCTRYFVEEKVDLTMSKGSLMGLVLGLMLLGILFFLSGFLAAVHLYTPSTSLTSLELPEHNPLASPYHLPTQSTYATSSSSRMPKSSGHLPTTPQRAVVSPSTRHPSDYIMKPPYTTTGSAAY